MSKQFRIESALHDHETGELVVDAVLPDGSHVRGARVPATPDQQALALSLLRVGSPHRLRLFGSNVTGIVHVEDRDYEAALARIEAEQAEQAEQAAAAVEAEQADVQAEAPATTADEATTPTTGKTGSKK